MADQKNHHAPMNVDEALSNSEEFILKHKTAIIGFIAGVIIVVCGFLMYKHLYLEPREEKAQIAIFKGQQYFEQDAYEVALNGDSIGYIGFNKIANQFSGTKTANLAKAYAGICYKNLGKYDEAVKALEGFNGDDQMISPAILGATGNCYAELGQLDKASSTLLKAADVADNSTLSPIFLMQAGEILEKQGKYEDAVTAYTKIKDKYFQSYQAMDIDKYIERAKLLKK
ncbi:tetratricopeptide repeat protein [Bacteroides ihuae]|uniref:tetratricopeptide repeat protein n=1 Tax=Bacteroides ihuae TaxID=1852362 RepID=UPI0008D90E8E|nr:tetratricopeptide repeat protein [Bacteroides ihuae]